VNINDLTIGQAKELAALFSSKNTTEEHHPYEIGKNYLIRTVTMIDTGRIVAVFPQEIVVEDAAWIADTGRFTGALQSCNFNEVEPFPEGKLVIGRGSIIDAVQIPTLPRLQK